MVEGIPVRDMEFRLAPEFAQDMLRHGKSESTVRIYQWAINRLLDFARSNEVVIIDRDTLKAWQDDLKNLNPHTAALAGVAIRRLLHWAADDQNDRRYRDLAFVVPTAKYERIKIPKTLTPVTLRRIEDYLMSLDRSSATVRELRDRALFYYIKGTAARVREILQVDRDRFEHDIIRHPGRNPRSLIPPPGVIGLVREYLAARTDSLDMLWVAYNTDGTVTPLQDAGVLQIWARLARKVGVPRFTTRQLRQTAGAILVERGHDLADVMAVMDLKDMRSVQGYQQLANDRLRRVRADLDVS